LASSIPPGAFTEVTLNTAGSTTANVNITDLVGNAIKAPQAQTATAGTPETTPPTISSASGAVGSTTITLNFSEPVFCTGITYSSEDFTLAGGTGTPPTIVSAGSDPCSLDRTTADTSFNLTTSTTLPADTVFTLTVTAEPGEVTDIAGNNLANPSSVTFTTGAADFTPPTIVDARMANNLVTTNFGDPGDSFTLTFSEKMNGSTTGTIDAQDQDGTTMAVVSGNQMVCGTNVSCTWNT